jgi:hypothetical protein
MKATELIRELAIWIELEGDLPVLIDNPSEVASEPLFAEITAEEIHLEIRRFRNEQGGIEKSLAIIFTNYIP